MAWAAGVLRLVTWSEETGHEYDNDNNGWRAWLSLESVSNPRHAYIRLAFTLSKMEFHTQFPRPSYTYAFRRLHVNRKRENKNPIHPSTQAPPGVPRPNPIPIRPPKPKLDSAHSRKSCIPARIHAAYHRSLLHAAPTPLEPYSDALSSPLGLCPDGKV